MQALPSLPVDGVLTISASNQAQQRGPHGLFRYFGKLAPDVTGAILDLTADRLGSRPRGPVVDLMCGSGTTLVEASLRGWSSIGIEVNPVAALYSRVKTNSVNQEALQVLQLAAVEGATLVSQDEAELVFSPTRNSRRWFSTEARRAVGGIRLALDRVPATPERDLLLAALLGLLRRASNASARTGRIFYDPNSAATDVVAAFSQSVAKIAAAVPRTPLPVDVRLADARATDLPDALTDFVFCHPPYFGLYRFSADVLRFELEIGGWDRAAIAPVEVREGWKSGDIANLDGHIADMAAVFREARRISRVGGLLALIASNSTLGNVQLPVIDRLAAAGRETGWRPVLHLERTAHFGSASYHRSARSDKVIERDHVVLMSAE